MWSEESGNTPLGDSTAAANARIQCESILRGGVFCAAGADEPLRYQGRSIGASNGPGGVSAVVLIGVCAAGKDAEISLMVGVPGRVSMPALGRCTGLESGITGQSPPDLAVGRDS